jgi:hypothetical protein
MSLFVSIVVRNLKNWSSQTQRVFNVQVADLRTCSERCLYLVLFHPVLLTHQEIRCEAQHRVVEVVQPHLVDPVIEERIKA